MGVKFAPVAAPARDVEVLDLQTLLTLENLGSDRFRGSCHAGSPGRIFGGHLAAQALTAACETVPAEMAAHSMHGYFLSAGVPGAPITYEVQRVRDGRSYRSRQVTAVQDDEPIFTLSASFKLPEFSADRQSEMPDVPSPEDLSDPHERWARLRPEHYRRNITHRVMSLRFVPDDVLRGQNGRTEQCVWFKPLRQFSGDPVLHVGALTYASDLTLASTASLDIQPHSSRMKDPTRIMMASLDHAMWFHRPFKADEWMLFRQQSDSATDGRGLSTGTFWTRDGVLAATVVQESLLRRIDGA